MIDLKRILWPTDFSENSKAAGVYACACLKVLSILLKGWPP
jgi:hypothetical protein